MGIFSLYTHKKYKFTTWKSGESVCLTWGIRSRGKAVNGSGFLWAISQSTEYAIR